MADENSENINNDKNSKINTRILLRLEGRVIALERDVHEIKERLTRDYTPLASFSPVQKIVFGFVAVMLVTVATAMVALVIKR